MNRNIYLVVSAALLGLALAVGGAGENFPLLEMILDLAALAGAVAFLVRPGPERLAALSRYAIALMAAILLLPACQLVPLPPSIWHALPGRDLAQEIDQSLGMSMWRPLTLDVESTVRALLNLIPACILFVGAVHLHTRDRWKLLLIIGIFALVNAILGIIQLATGGSMTPYPSSHIGYPIGLFVNRNHTAALLLVSMPAIAALAARRMREPDSRIPSLAGALAALTILAVLVIGTTSRMALVLLPLALAGSLALLFFRQSVWRIAVPSTLVLAAIAASISWVGGLNRNLARFSSLHDGRFDYWSDVSWALHHYGLAGTGFGTFIPVYQTAESLSSVSPQILNHAHNDFIEIVLEGGAPAVVLLVLFFVILALAIIGLARKRFEFNQALPALVGATGIVILLLFSLVDYPLRMPALSCVFALLCACMLPTPLPVAREGEAIAAAPSKRSAPLFRSYAVRGVSLAVIAGIAVLVVQAGASEISLLAGNPSSARAWAPWSTAAHEALADDALASSRLHEATAEARQTLRLSPIDAVAVRTAAMTRAVGGSAAAGENLMELAVSLGWRDPITQLWAIGASEQTGEPDKAVERAEALFQQGLFFPSSLELLLRDAPAGPTTGALIHALASSPEWRAPFVKALAQLPSRDLAKIGPFASQLNQSAVPLSVEEAEPLLDRFIAGGDIASAQRLWAETHRAALIANGGFEQLSLRNGADTPASWDISDEDLATIAVQAPDFGGHGRALRISAAARSGPILSQRLMLQPATYVLSYRARSGTGATVALRWDLRCTPSESDQASDPMPASSGAWHESAWQFTVPFQDCPIQRLSLARPDGIDSREIWVDDILLKTAAH